MIFVLSPSSKHLLQIPRPFQSILRRASRLFRTGSLSLTLVPSQQQGWQLRPKKLLRLRLASQALPVRSWISCIAFQMRAR